MDNSDNCPHGIRNQKDIERLEEYFKVMLKHMQDGVDLLNNKMDTLGEKVDELKEDIPAQIDAAVDAKWKTGVYDAVKWIFVLVMTGTIGIVLNAVFRG